LRQCILYIGINKHSQNVGTVRLENGLKCKKINLVARLCPHPLGSLHRSPYPLAGCCGRAGERDGEGGGMRDEE